MNTNPPPDLGDQRLDVGAGRLSLVHDEVRVDGRHHGVADARPLEARLVDDLLDPGQRDAVGAGRDAQVGAAGATGVVVPMVSH